jgi:hypothetical protein
MALLKHPPQGTQSQFAANQAFDLTEHPTGKLFTMLSP